MNENQESLKDDLEKTLKEGKGPAIGRFALAVLSGVVPWVGGAIAGTGGAWSEAGDAKFKKILAAWLKMQEDEIIEIGKTLTEILQRLDKDDEEVIKRIESPEYLSLIK